MWAEIQILWNRALSFAGFTNQNKAGPARRYFGRGVDGSNIIITKLKLSQLRGRGFCQRVEFLQNHCKC